MESEKWELVKDIFDAALRQSYDRREQFIAEACQGDDELRREVQSLLSSFDNAGGFLQKPAVGEVAEIVVGEKKQFAIGQEIGQYEIIRQIGAGGMGEVYLARDIKLNRRVALKILSENLSAEPESKQRLLREAQAAATLEHPNICAIYEIADRGGYSFIVMQYVVGETLAEKLGKEKLSVEKSLDLAIQIADALAEADEHHIIHRDIKPANVIIGEKGQAKVLDFGLAKFVQAGSEEKTEQILSKPGAIMGTVPYMSPEQVRGAALDARTDIFSFGAMFYEMLSGQQPFARENNAETIAAILYDEPRWTEIPSKFQSIVKKSLQKNREERYQKTQDLARDLRQLQSSAISNQTGDHYSDAQTVAFSKISTRDISPTTTRQPKNQRNFSLPILAVLILVIGTGIGYGLYYLFSRADPPAEFRMLNLTRLTSNGKTKFAAVSPDGRFVAYVVDDEGQNSLRLKNIAAESDVQILPAAEGVGLSHLTFSPSGNFLYYAANEMLYQLPMLGGLPKKILQNFGVSRQNNPISFSPDGKQFAFVRYSSEGAETASLVIADSDGTNERLLIATKRPDIFLGSAVWSPDGKVIACIMTDSDIPGHNIVAVVRIADGSVSKLPSPGWSAVSQIVWQPEGKGLFVTATKGRSSIFYQIWSLSYPNGEARNISNDFNNYQSISLTANGRGLVAVRMAQASYIWVMSSDETNQARQFTRGIDKYDGIWGLNFLSDGRIIYESTPNGKGEVRMMDADGGNERQITDESGSTCASPDGKYLVFQSSDEGGTGLFRLDLDNGEKKRLTTGADVWATFSPDGKWIVFTRWAEQVALWKVSGNGGEAVKLTNFSDFPLAPSVSPDGKFIAFYWRKRDQKRSPQIVIISFSGGEAIKSFDVPIQYFPGFGKDALQWTSNGQAISYVVFRDNVSNIWRQPVNGSPPVQITEFTDQRIFNFAYSPDGKQLALSRGTFERDIILINNPEKLY